MTRPENWAPDMSGLGFDRDAVLVVTGAASGIGRAAAVTAARAGVHVAAWDVDKDGCESVVEEITAAGGRAHLAIVDVADTAAVEGAWRQAAEAGPCRYLFNNAGPASVTDAPIIDSVSRAIGAMINVTESWLTVCPEDAESVVFTSSIVGTWWGGSSLVQSFYPVAKGAIASYSRHLAVREGGRPRANTIAPSYTLTPRTESWINLPGYQEQIRRNPMNRPALAQEPANVACFLLSPAASFVNGTLIAVDGGLVAAS
ncbi:SDR family oxidoreductase [Sporichthya brevicatena]|uniref:SDR family oxidoreductase n=1 Tax=Sporichthya brevicatena TaxID=171442 RepID=A0ABP3RVK8_9ACTN